MWSHATGGGEESKSWVFDFPPTLTGIARLRLASNRLLKMIVGVSSLSFSSRFPLSVWGLFLFIILSILVVSWEAVSLVCFSWRQPSGRSLGIAVIGFLFVSDHESCVSSGAKSATESDGLTRVRTFPWRRKDAQEEGSRSTVATRTALAAQQRPLRRWETGALDRSSLQACIAVSVDGGWRYKSYHEDE